MAKHPLHSKAKEYALDKIHEWDECNPAPEQPAPEPELPKNAYVSTPNSFVAIEPDYATTRIHIVANGHKHVYVEMDVRQLRELMDKLLEVESDMTELHRWNTHNSPLQKAYQKYHGDRSTQVELLMAEYLEANQSGDSW